MKRHLVSQLHVASGQPLLQSGPGQCCWCFRVCTTPVAQAQRRQKLLATLSAVHLLSAGCVAFLKIAVNLTVSPPILPNCSFAACVQLGTASAIRAHTAPGLTEHLTWSVCSVQPSRKATPQMVMQHMAPALIQENKVCILHLKHTGVRLLIGGGAGHMAAVQALACLVHCPVKSTGMQPLRFPASEVLQEASSTASADQAAALERLEKVLQFAANSMATVCAQPALHSPQQ